MAQLTQKRAALYTAVAAIIIAGVAIYWMNTKPPAAVPDVAMPSETAEPIVYSTGGLPVTVEKIRETVSLTSAELAANAAECGTERPESDFDGIVDLLNGAERTIYRLTYTNDGQQPNDYVISLIPNLPGYASFEDFRADFDQCFAGGDAYPTISDDAWLVFTSGCGSGFDDGSERPIGCEEIMSVVGPSLFLR